MYMNKYPESAQICHLFFIGVCKTGHLTALWTENVSEYKIERKSVHLTCKISNITWSVCVALKVYIVHKYGMYMNKYPESAHLCHYFFGAFAKHDI